MLGTPGPFFVLTQHEMESDPYKKAVFFLLHSPVDPGSKSGLHLVS